MIKSISCLLFTSVLSGCASQTTTSISTPSVLPTYSDAVAIPKATPTNLKNIDWVIHNQYSIQQLIKTHGNEPYMLYSLNSVNMQILVGNMDDLARYIKEQQAVIAYLTGLIDLRRETVTKDNK